ncbi:MAG TPA: FxLYD domain-containing protein [Myxococcales bacterium LLY-WYZ-16_1]|jgi:hypothetical protein|nr:FxLYD domain-containing protein [Myxococcales bacterium LLY-WYZ-16_1]
MRAWVVALVALGGIGLAAYLGLGGTELPEAPPPVDTEPDGPMTEKERIAYVEEFVRVSDLAIGPDLDPDGNEVPGLQRVSGKLRNTGDRPVDKVIVAVFPKDERGNVLGVEQQDVIERGVLEPGEVEEFRFQVRERKAFSGRFDHEVR